MATPLAFIQGCIQDHFTRIPNRKFMPVCPRPTIAKSCCSTVPSICCLPLHSMPVSWSRWGLTTRRVIEGNRCMVWCMKSKPQSLRDDSRVFIGRWRSRYTPSRATRLTGSMLVPSKSPQLVRSSCSHTDSMKPISSCWLHGRPSVGTQ